MLGQEALNDFVLKGQHFERVQQIMYMEVLEKDLIKKGSMSSKLFHVGNRIRGVTIRLRSELLLSFLSDTYVVNRVFVRV